MNSQRVSLPSQRVMFCKHEVHPDFLEKGLDVRFRQTTFSISSLSLTAGPRGAPGEKERGGKESAREKEQGCDWGTKPLQHLVLWSSALSCQNEFLSYKGIRLPSLSAFKLLAPSYTKYNSKPKDIDCKEQFKYDFLIAINMYALNRSTPLSSLWYYEKNVPSGA